MKGGRLSKREKAFGAAALRRLRSAGARDAPELAPKRPISSPAPAPTEPRAIAEMPPMPPNPNPFHARTFANAGAGIPMTSTPLCASCSHPLPGHFARCPTRAREMRMLDLFSGSGNASRAAKVRGWEVIRVDNGPGTATDIRADLSTWEPWKLAYAPVRASFDLIWASPPCTQLSTANQKTRDVDEGLVLVRAALRIIAELKPRWWVLENVHGATRAIGELIGPPVARYGSFYLWGNFPPFEANVPREKTKLSGRRRAERRAAIPWAISNGLICACEALAKELE